MLQSLHKWTVLGSRDSFGTGGIQDEHLSLGLLGSRIQYKMDGWTRRALKFLLREKVIVLIGRNVSEVCGSGSVPRDLHEKVLMPPPLLFSSKMKLRSVGCFPDPEPDDNTYLSISRLCPFYCGRLRESNSC